MTTKKKQGFTIIEVVLVLAIAGLIFLVVFLALPALQRSQRDTQRKNDLGRLMSQVSSYQSNSRGAVPASGTSFQTNFVVPYLNAGGDTFEEPRGGAYTYTFTAGSPTSNYGEIRYVVGGRCGTGGTITGGGTTRQVAAAVNLEGGGGYCQQN